MEVGWAQRTRRWLGLVVISLALTAAGCGEEEPSADAGAEADTTATVADEGAAGATDPCQLLTDADVREILGRPAQPELVVEGDPETGAPAQCRWTTNESANLVDPGSRPFNFHVDAGDRAWYENSRNLVEEDERFELLDGLGDEAFAGDTRSGALLGESGLTVELGIAVVPEAHEVAIDVLERVVANY